MQRSSVSPRGRADAGGEVPASVEEVLSSPGQPLDRPRRSFFGSRLGRDMSRVRVHTDARAAQSARDVGALAYTAGHHVVLGSAPPRGRDYAHLLAHELVHTLQQSDGEGKPRSIAPDRSPAEDEADRIATDCVDAGRSGARVVSGGVSDVQRYPPVGTPYRHPTGAHSAYRRVETAFDGRDFEVKGDGSSILKTTGQSGRPVSVRAADARACGGATSETYLNNPRYVGIRDYGAIPEGDFRFQATDFATFSPAEQLRMIGGGYFTDPFGATIHGGDWGAGRAPLNPVRVLPGPCGSTARRSGFFLHGGSLTGSSGCIDIANAGIAALLPLLSGYTGRVPVRVRYTHPPPTVGTAARTAGGFVYPGQENPSITDRLRGAWEQFSSEATGD